VSPIGETMRMQTDDRWLLLFYGTAAGTGVGLSCAVLGHLLLVKNNAAVIVCAVAAGAFTASFVTMFRL